MNPRVRQILTLALRAVPMAAWKRVYHRDLVAFCYHVVSERDLPHVSNIYAFKRPEMFEADLRYISRHFDVARPDDLLDRGPSAARNGRTQALLTFDDGFREFHSVIQPLLRKNDVPALFFVTTDWLDNKAMFYRHVASICVDRLMSLEGDERAEALERAQRLGQSFAGTDDLLHFIFGIRADRRTLLDDVCDVLRVDPTDYLARHRPYLTSQEVSQLEVDGSRVGAHSLNHFDFTTLEPKEIERQVVESCQIVAELTGRPQVPFSFPFTMRGLDRSVLSDIARRAPVVGPMFGTAGIDIEPPYINRVFADRPTGPRQMGSNIHWLLQREYTGFTLDGRWRR